MKAVDQAKGKKAFFPSARNFYLHRLSLEKNRNMGFAVYHMEKGKTSCGGIGNHIDRAAGAEHSYPHADPERRGENRSCEVNSHCKKPLHQAIADRISEGYRGKKAIRSDAVKYQTHILTGTHGDMERIFSDGKTARAWISANQRFIIDEFGKENIVRFVLHMDERTPHIHAVTIPLTNDGRLSAKEVTGNRSDMQARQDRYAEAMKPFGLERGIRNTGISHEGAREYYARMEHALKTANEGETRGHRGLLGGYTRESVLELEKSVKSLKTALSEKSAELVMAKHGLSVETGWRDEKIRKTEEKSERLLLDDGFREETAQKRFEKALVGLTLEVEAKARETKQKGATGGRTEAVDDAIRRHMRKLNPNLNPWEALERYSGGRRDEVEKMLHGKWVKAQEKNEANQCREVIALERTSSFNL